jgi:ADP-heptose:LPS heptosyltransferase
LAVGVDTGLLHMAGALDVPWIGLFGPTNPEMTGPYDRAGGISIVAPFEKPASCGSCWKHFKYEDDSCRTLDQGSCMSYLSEDEVLDACLHMLEGAGGATYGELAQPLAAALLPELAGSASGR